MKFRHICNAPLFRHILLAATLLLTSCTYRSLKNVESVMEKLSNVHVRSDINRVVDNAESLFGSDDSMALAIMSNIDIKSVKKRKLKARCALVYSEALYKNYVTAPDDSLIMIAVKYYSDGNDIEHQFRSYYMLGCILSELKLTEEAAVALVQAEQLSCSISDKYRLGLLYTQLGKTFFDSFDFNRAINYYRLAYDNYDTASKDSHKIHVLYNIGRCQIQIEDEEQAHSIFEDVCASAIKLKDWRLLYNSLCSQIFSSLKLNEVSQASNEIDYFIQQFGYPTKDSYALYLFALYNVKAGNREEARHYINDAWKYAKSASDSIKLFNTEYLFEQQFGSMETALQNFEKSINLQNRNLYLLQDKPALGAMKDYFKTAVQAETLVVSHRQRTILLMGISFILSLIILFLIFHSHKLRIESDRQELMLTIKNLRLKEDSDNQLINQLYSQVNSVFSRPYSELDKVYNLYMQTIDYIDIKEKYCNEKEKVHMYHDKTGEFFKNIKLIFSKLSSDIYQTELDKVINSTCHDIMARLAEAKLSKKDLIILRLSIAGFSSRTISHILQIPLKTFYQNRSRAIQKVELFSADLASKIRIILNIK